MSIGDLLNSIKESAKCWDNEEVKQYIYEDKLLASERGSDFYKRYYGYPVMTEKKENNMFYKIMMLDHQEGTEYFLESYKTLEEASRCIQMLNFIRLVTNIDDRYRFFVCDSNGTRVSKRV